MPRKKGAAPKTYAEVQAELVDRLMRSSTRQQVVTMAPAHSDALAHCLCGRIAYVHRDPSPYIVCSVWTCKKPIDHCECPDETLPEALRCECRSAPDGEEQSR